MSLSTQHLYRYKHTKAFMTQFHYLERTEALVCQKLTEHALSQALLHIPTKNKLTFLPAWSSQ